jgi:hypothetical protein
MRILKGHRFENILKVRFMIMTSMDTDLRNGHRIETGR